MSDKKQTVDLGLLEEDDEFEEFPAEGEYFTCYLRRCWSCFLLHYLLESATFFFAVSCCSDSASLAY